MTSEFTGKTIFITGGNRGIGLAIRNRFETLGAKMIAPSHNELDLLSRDNITSYLEKLADIPDIVIHCAGLNIKSELEDLSLAGL